MLLSGMLLHAADHCLPLGLSVLLVLFRSCSFAPAAAISVACSNSLVSLLMLMLILNYDVVVVVAAVADAIDLEL